MSFVLPSFKFSATIYRKLDEVTGKHLYVNVVFPENFFVDGHLNYMVEFKFIFYPYKKPKEPILGKKNVE